MRSLVFLLSGVLLVSSYQPVVAHAYMRKPFQARYKLRTVSCYACHVKRKKKEEVTEFGKVIKKLLEGQNVVARVEAAKDLDRAEKDLAMDELTKEFVEVLKKLDKMKTPEGEWYADVIRAGRIEGVKPRRGAAGGADAESEDDGEADEDEEDDESEGAAA
jgi:hypothetical protein